MGASLCILLLLVSGAVTEINTNLRIRMENFEQCEDKKNLSNTIENIVFTQEGLNEIIVNGNFIIRREAVPPLTIKVVVQKCPSKENKHLCEYFMSLRFQHVCNDIRGNTIWGRVWKQTKLPKSCPLKKGNYSINGLKVNTVDSLFSGMGVENGFWKVRTTGSSPTGMWVCTDSEFEIFSENKKRPRKPKNKPGNRRPQ